MIIHSINPVNFHSINNTSTGNKSNNATTIVVETLPYTTDNVDLSTKDKKKTKKKILLGIGGTVTAGAILLTALFSVKRNVIRNVINKFEKNRIDELLKLYKEKLVISNLPEHINFKEATSIEEGINFSKNVLGIKEVDKNFSLDAINFINKGIVDVSNAQKGKLFIPKHLHFKDEQAKEEGLTLAYVKSSIYSKDFGALNINRNFFNKEFMDTRLKRKLYYDMKPMYTIDDKTGKLLNFVSSGIYKLQPNAEVTNLIQKFYKDSSSLSLKEQRTLYYSLNEAEDSALKSYRNPYEALKLIVNEKGDFLKANNWNIDLSEIARLNTSLQLERLKDIDSFLKVRGEYFIKEFDIEPPEGTIYHEMGHLQDFAKNLKELDLKDAVSTSSIKTGIEVNNRVDVKEVNNRWGSIGNEKYDNEFKRDSYYFQKQYPEFYEFLTDEKIKLTTGKVSEYAQSGIGEFVAEVYRKKITKQAIPEDVEALYKKYNGPELPA